MGTLETTASIDPERFNCEARKNRKGDLFYKAQNDSADAMLENGYSLRALRPLRFSFTVSTAKLAKIAKGTYSARPRTTRRMPCWSHP
jgi:hypothetical protein